jgi:hypothetical protein
MVVAGPFFSRYTAPMRCSSAYRFVLLVGLLGVLGLGCDDDDDDFQVGLNGPLVGGPCLNEYDCFSGGFCPGGQGVPDGDYPGGTCTVPCNGHEDCPSTTACIDDQRGICLLQCFENRDCRPGYKCKERNDNDGPGRSRVCTK